VKNGTIVVNKLYYRLVNGMKKLPVRINYYAEESDFQEVKDALKSNKDLRMHIRYTVILNYLQGYNFKEIASMHNISPLTVSTYVKKYKAGGIDALKMGKSPGAPRHLTHEQEAELVNIITTKTPDEFGFTATKNWDTTILRQLVLKRFGVSFCQRGMLEVLYRNGFSYTRPTYSLEKADSSKQVEFKETFELLKKSN
jgi:putative transposase